MIIDAKQSNIETMGDIQEFKTGIDPKNLEYITTLLSSNLYSEPEKSFVRETVSNAWDSHIEAGTTDTPILIELKGGAVSIRDFGVGLSPERFKEIWCNIGSSTKRESNDFIGGFGIGRFSALACSDAVYITSYYNGTAYHYIMVKENNAITTNLVASIPTTEKNGVEVTIKGVLTDHNSINKYRDALRYIHFFPNIYINDACGGIYKIDISNKKIAHFDNFAYINRSINDRLLLGNVLYPIKSDLFDNNCKEILRHLENTGVVLKFNIGEISITPNRESIIYTNDTIKKIKDKIVSAYAEMISIMKKNVGKDYTDCTEFHNYLNSYYIQYDFIEHKLTRGSSYGLNISKEEFLEFSTFRGVTFNMSEASVLKNAMNYDLPNIRAIFYDGRFYTAKPPYSAAKYSKLGYAPKPPIIVKNCSKLTAFIKNYISDHYSSAALITHVDKIELSSIVDKCSSTYMQPSVRDIAKAKIAQGMYEYLTNTCKVIDFSTDKDFLKYKEEAAKEAKELSVRFKTKEFLLHYYDKSFGWAVKQIHRFTGITNFINWIKEKGTGIVIGTVGETTEDMILMAKERGYSYITGNKEVIRILKETNLSCIVSPQFLYRDDPRLAKVYTLYNYRHFTLDELYTLEKILPETERREINKLVTLLLDNDSKSYFRKFAFSNAIEDPYIKYLCDKYNKYKSILTSAALDLGFHEFSNKDIHKLLLREYIRKNRLFRMDHRVYKDLNNSNIIRLVCRK